MTCRSSQPGASLAATLAALILIECVILGTLHLAMAERQVATAAAGILRLRLAADAALAEAAGQWPGAAADLVPGGDMPVHDRVSPDGFRIHVSLRRIQGDLYLLRATADEPPPAPGHAAAAMLVLAPLLPDEFRAAAALDAAAPIPVPAAWSLPPHLDSLLVSLLAGGGRLAGRQAAMVLHGAAELSGEFTGVVLADGDLRLLAGSRIDGFVFVGRTLRVDDGATLRGAYMARSVAASSQFLEADSAGAERALLAAGARQPGPAPGRSRVPAY